MMKKQKLCYWCAERLKNAYIVNATEQDSKAGICEACHKKTLVRKHFVSLRPKVTP
ncbi:MAG: hypothetical protein RR949_07470 [Oscillospiraceae bacterium]